MSDFYLMIVIILFALAIADLIVGVSNDAVNFLISAVGSKVAPRTIIMIVASLGVFVGATFSSGIMEVARKGIFNPQYFVFSEVMVIFIAVMITDIILLDFFNILGLPTSTTVSIVFELLGAAVVVSLIKISAQGGSFEDLSTYINSSRALLIIAGIFLSVVFAFLLGTLIQYLSRLLFSFTYEKRMKYVGAAWSGLALTALTYFMVIKGIKGASFVDKEQIDWFQNNAVLILGVSFVTWTLILQFFWSVLKINVLKIIVLFGTFGLAMAFAGNDLVNFIGVPIAGFESFNFWRESGMAADSYSMGALADPVQTPTFLLLLAGLIMVITLWTSRKARSVTETTVNLSRQEEGSERFSPNMLSRGIVRLARQVARVFVAITPERLMNKMESNFDKKDIDSTDKKSPPPAFDLVRASVNLTVASILIAFATSLKLPLSTTYVSFMVAMGTSLADRAWGRDSAVYRVAGVISVVGGWFMTAFTAFMVSGTFALLIYHFEGYAVIGLVLFAATMIVRGYIYHRRKEREKQKQQEFEFNYERVQANQVIDETRLHIADTLDIISEAYSNTLKGVIEEDRKVLKKAKGNIKALHNQNNQFKYNLYTYIKRIDEDHNEGSRVYLLMYDLEQDIISTITSIVKSGRDHVSNIHNPLKKKQVEQIKGIDEDVSKFFSDIGTLLRASSIKPSGLIDRKKQLLDKLEGQLLGQISGIKDKTYGSKNSLLYFNVLLQTKDLIAVATRFVKLIYRVQQKDFTTDRLSSLGH